MMRALSVIQPWPYALLWLGKDVENRGWRSAPPAELVGQRFCFHASKTLDVDAAADLVEEGFALPQDMPLGAIVGSARLRGWVRDDGALCGAKVVKHSASLTHEEAVALVRSRWRVGTLLLAVDQRLPFAEPIPCKGALGFWTPADADQERIAQADLHARALGFDPPPPAIERGALWRPPEPKPDLRRDHVSPRKVAATRERARARAMFEAAGRPVPAWAREP